jgi:hypothetical protein
MDQKAYNFLLKQNIVNTFQYKIEKEYSVRRISDIIGRSRGTIKRVLRHKWRPNERDPVLLKMMEDQYAIVKERWGL